MAVFLALAVGIVVGTTALNGPVLENLNSRIAGLNGDKRALEAQLGSARARSADQDRAAQVLAPVVAAGRLTGQRVVLVSTPDAPGPLREDLAPLLTGAGAHLGASVRLRPALLDPASASLLEDLVARVAVPGVDLPAGEPVERALAQIASVLVRRPGQAALPAGTARRVLAAYQGEDLVDVEGSVDAPATLAVVLAGDPTAAAGPQTDDAPASALAAVGLARALDERGSGTVVAGSLASAGGRGVLRVLRDDNGVTDRVSSVDTADTATGRLGVVLALQEQAAGRSGAYGSGAGVRAAVPQPAP